MASCKYFSTSDLDMERVLSAVDDGGVSESRGLDERAGTEARTGERIRCGAGVLDIDAATA